MSPREFCAIGLHDREVERGERKVHNKINSQEISWGKSLEGSRKRMKSWRGRNVGKFSTV